MDINLKLETLETKNLETILLNDEHIINVIKSKYVLPDKNIFLDNCLNKKVDVLILSAIYDYVSSPIILDNFGEDHYSRRNWRIKKEDEFTGFYDLYQTNPLRANKISALRSSFELFHLFHDNDKYSSLALSAKKIYDEMYDDSMIYNSLSFDKKMLLVNELRQKSYDFLMSYNSLD